MVNLLERMNSKSLMWEATSILKNTHIDDDSDIIDWISNQGSPIRTKGENEFASDSDTSIDNSEHYDGELRQFEQIDDENEFKDIELGQKDHNILCN
jgi:hypothetical protein